MTGSAYHVIQLSYNDTANDIRLTIIDELPLTYTLGDIVVQALRLVLDAVIHEVVDHSSQ